MMKIALQQRLAILLMVTSLVTYDIVTISILTPQIVQRFILMIQFVPLLILLIRYIFSKNSFELKPKIFVFAFVLIMNVIYISKIFTSGSYYLLQTNYEIFSSMRTPTAIIMLQNTGHLRVIDPHYYVPLEYIAVYLISAISGMSAVGAYGITLSLVRILMWLIISLMFYKILYENDNNLRHNIYKRFLLTLTIILVVTLPVDLIFGEFTIARIFFIFILMIFFFKDMKNIKNLILIFLLISGVFLDSLRDTIVILAIFGFSSILYSIKFRKIPLLLLLIAAMTVVLFYEMPYISGYVGIFSYFITTLENSMPNIKGFIIPNPPLHTIIKAPIPIVEKIIEFLGAIAFITTIIITYFLSIIGLIRLIKARAISDIRIITSLSIYTVHIMIVTLAIILYFVNFFGWFRLDFEVLTSLMSYIYFIPFIYLFQSPKEKIRNYININKLQYLIIILFTVFLLLFSAQGFALRNPIKSYGDIVLFPYNQNTGMLSLNNIYIFILNYINNCKIISNNAYFQLYLSLPFKYYGISFNYTFNIKLPNQLIYSDGYYFIFYQNCTLLIPANNFFLPY